MTPRFLPAGDTALLVELADLDAVLALFASLGADLPPGVIELVPAARTLAVLATRNPRVLSAPGPSASPTRRAKASSSVANPSTWARSAAVIGSPRKPT